MSRVIKTADGKIHLPLTVEERLTAARRLLEIGCTVEQVTEAANLPLTTVQMEAHLMQRGASCLT